MKTFSLILASLLTLRMFSAETVPHPPEMILVNTYEVTGESVPKWKAEGFSSVVVMVDEQTSEGSYQKASDWARSARMGFYCWIEVGRCEKLADAHPLWMASIGANEDWKKRFPNAPKAATNEVTKAYPWVPIRTVPAFKNQLNRVIGLLGRLSGDFDGVFLNDLQGSPSSCGCGNPLCRWATDYRVPLTAERTDPILAAGDFVDQALRGTAGKRIIPVWTTECEETDRPPEKVRGGIGLCGSIECALDVCPKEFRAQLAGLRHAHKGNLALLALHKKLEHADSAGNEFDWIERSARYLKTAGNERQKPWIVVQGFNVSPAEELSARQAAARWADRVIVARIPLEQSFTPRVVRLKP